MSTINDYQTIQRIIARNGDDDCPPGEPPEPPVIRIVEYTNAWGTRCWGVVWAGDPNPYRYDQPTPHIGHPRLIFVRQSDPAP